ncbi:MAG: hypothetical protein R3C19_23505 [Planctomycetaceae bacterium]
MHDSDETAHTADHGDSACHRALDLIDAAYSLEIQKYQLLIARERRRRTEEISSADFVIRQHRAA